MREIFQELKLKDDGLNYALSFDSWSVNRYICFSSSEIKSSSEFNYNPFRSAVCQFVKSKDLYLSLTVQKVVQDNDFEFLKSIFLTGLYLELALSGTKNYDQIFCQFCRLSGVNSIYTNPTYLDLNTSEKKTINLRSMVFEQMLLDLMDVPASAIVELFNSDKKEWRSSGLDIEIEGLFQWCLVERYSDYISSQDDLKTFDFWSLPFEEREKFYTFYLEFLDHNKKAIILPLVELWLNKIRSYSEIYQLDVSSNIVSNKKTGASIYLQDQQVAIIKILKDAPTSNEDIVNKLGVSGVGTFKKAKSVLNKEFKRHFNENLVGAIAQAGSKKILNVLNFELILSNG